LLSVCDENGGTKVDALVLHLVFSYIIAVVIVCAQATCMHVMHNWSDYMSYSYMIMKCDGYRLSWTHVSLLFDLLGMM
jgi:hypothetical protein